jgi:hypothetical protein
MNADDIPLTICWFPTATPDGGPALGDPECMTWRQFVGVFWFRREGPKDGPAFVPARFSLEANSRQVRRLKTNLLARTAIALDIEGNPKTGELPPDLDEAARRAEAKGLASLLYSSHSHVPPATVRYRREAKLAAGFDPTDSLIDKLRSRFDLHSVLTSHGYGRQGAKYRHPNSSSGCFGADVRTFGGIERIYSHNAGDPLHADNLPDWCNGVTALDVIDVVVILDFNGDRPRALRELAQRFGIGKTEERKELAGLIFRLIRQRAPQAAIESSAFTEGLRLGMSRGEVIATAQWVAAQATIQAEVA